MFVHGIARSFIQFSKYQQDSALIDYFIAQQEDGYEKGVYCDVKLNCINVYFRNIVLLGGPNFKKKKKKKKIL